MCSVVIIKPTKAGPAATLAGDGGVSVGSLAVSVVRGESREHPIDRLGPMQRSLCCRQFYTGWKADTVYLVST